MEEKPIEIPKKVTLDEMKKDTADKDKKKDTLTNISMRVKKLEDRLDLVMNFSAGSFYTASGVAYMSGPWWLGPLLTLAGMASSYFESLIRKLKERYGISISEVRKQQGGLAKALTTIRTS